MENQDFSRFCQESEGHIRQAQNMKVRGGPPNQNMKARTQFFAWAPHLYVFKGGIKKLLEGVQNTPQGLMLFL